MRASGVLFTAIAIVFFIPTYAFGQSSDPRPPEEQPEPYHKHHDTRQGHDHYYPDRGSIVRDVPQGAIMVSYAGLTYRFHDGVWFEPRGPAFMVVAPPIGLVVTTLPAFATVLAQHGELYLYCNDVYYLPRPDLSGYEVVNDPGETVGKPKSAAAVAAPGVGKPALAARAATPPAAAAAGTADDDPGEPAVATPAAIPVARTVGAAPGAPSSAAPMSLPMSAIAPAAGVSAAAISPPATVTPAAISPASASATTVTGTSAVVPMAAVMRSSPMPGSNTPAAPTDVATSGPSSMGATPAGTALVSPPVVPTPGPAPTESAPTGSAGPITLAAANTGPATTAPIAVPAVAKSQVTLPATSPPATTPPTPSDPPKGIRATLSPRNNQSADQLAHDRYDCYRFAVAQTGFDPVRSGSVASPTATQQRYEYDRAQSACFEARGYTVR